MADDKSNNLPADRRTLQMQKEAEIDAAFQNPDNTVVPRKLEDEMRKSFIDYAMSVITDRALPDIRDGLKPVHRRILYSMFTQGFTPDKPYRKCATTVGDVLGRFHPHGDAAVYDALVRMAQDFSMRHILVDGHGNFGSRDGDPAAAYRYTEARLTKLAMDMMANINKDTVDFQPNFDEHVMEPTVLPTAFPNLLVNGSTGIAVGMATNIPPHNLGETIDAAIHMIDNPEATADELMEYMPGPDFPTYGTIVGTGGLRNAYRTGRGRIIVRSDCEIEEMRGNRYRILVHDLPYQVNKARLIERIAELSKEKKIEGISDVRDESDRHEEVRIVIELKRDATPSVVLNQLYRHTQLQDSFSFNMIALIPTEDGHYEPKLVGLPEILHHFILHQQDVVRRRTEYDLEKAEARRHIVEGLRLAIDHIDEVINIIRSSANENEAKVRLQERFGLSEKQSQHVVDMRLGRLSGLEREKLQSEYEDLCEKIDWFTRVLNEEELLNDVIKDEMLDIKRRYADERRTQIKPGMIGEIDDESLIEEEQIVVTMSHLGYIKRIPVDVYSAQHRGGRGITAMSTRDEDYVDTLLTTSTHDYLLFFTNQGRVYKLKGYQLPEAGRTARGMAIVNLLRLEPDEKISDIIPVEGFGDGDLIMATRSGLVKKTALSEYVNIHKNGLIAINLRDGDQLVNVRVSNEASDIVLVTKKGMAIRFEQSDVRATGRNTQGVKGITLNRGDEVIGMVSTDTNDTLLVITENGFGKRTELSDYRRQNRGGKGLITYRVTKRTGELVGAALIGETRDLLLVNDLGIMIRLSSDEIPVLSRNTQGVTLMRSREGKVVDIAIIEHEEVDEAEEADAENGEATSEEPETAPAEVPDETDDSDEESSDEQ